jgi:hypothetical protein
MDNRIMQIKMKISELENERVRSERYYNIRIDELRHQINKLIDERNKRLSEKD